MNEEIYRSLADLMSLAVEEDIGSGDVTSLAVFDESHMSRAEIVAKEEGIFCGGDVARFCYNVIDPAIRVEPLATDGDRVLKGHRVMNISGPTIPVLSGERIVLNFLQRMSGIATRTAFFVELAGDSGIQILDTRKTLPGYRLLDKYAVRTGGGRNHRMGLHDMVMIKDNHIKAAGSITRAVAMVREKHGRRYTVEVEASTPAEAAEALSSGAEIIMLDNMDRGMIMESVEIIGGRAKIEISGNMDEEKILMLRDLRIDYISLGALTHSVRAFDLSMKFL